MQHHPIGTLDLTIGPRMSDGGEIEPDVVLLAKFPKDMTGKLRAVVGDDRVWHSKAADDVVDELDSSARADTGARLHLDPLGELVDGDEEVGEALGCWSERPEKGFETFLVGCDLSWAVDGL